MREFELVKLDETRAVGILNPMRPKTEAMYRGREGKITVACARRVQNGVLKLQIPAS